jgi:GNAT superfamily N-acetyltransferase
VTLAIREATLSDLDTVTHVLAEASDWLASRGLDQWQYPPRRDRVNESIQAGECFVAEIDGKVVATITVDGHADSEFWQADDVPESALYVHRLAVRRDVAGRELGTTMLAWACDRAYQAGKAWLRLDAWRSNAGLLDYYQSRGWDYVRTIELEHRKSGALFQRPAQPLDGLG